MERLIDSDRPRFGAEDDVLDQLGSGVASALPATLSAVATSTGVGSWRSTSS